MMVKKTMISLHEYRKIYDILVKYAESIKIRVNEHGKSECCPGIAYYWEKNDIRSMIELSDEFDDEDRVYVVIHELAHLLIDGNVYKGYYTREYEADYVATRFCRHFEIDLPYYYGLDDSHVDLAIDFGMLSELADDFINRCR